MNTKIAFNLKNYEVFSHTEAQKWKRIKTAPEAKSKVQTFFAKDAETIRQQLARAKWKAKNHPSFFELMGSRDDALI